MSDLFEAFLFSVPKKGKIKNGDSVLTHYLDDEQLLVLVLSDGVSSCSADWLASELTCTTSISHFKNLNNLKLRDRICQSIQETNKVLCENIDHLMATLIFIVWDIQSNKIYYVDIGDSKLLKAKIDSIEQISDDDIQRAPARSIDGFIKLMDAIVYTNELTKVIGNTTHLQFEIKEVNFNDDEVIILCSDGIYDEGIIPQTLRAVIGKTQCDEELESFVADSARINQDDASLILLRKKEYSNNMKEVANQIFESSTKDNPIFEYIITNLSLKIINEDITAKNIEHLETIINYLLTNNIHLQKEKMVKLFNQLLLSNINDNNVILGFRKLIQLSYT